MRSPREQWLPDRRRGGRAERVATGGQRVAPLGAVLAQQRHDVVGHGFEQLDLALAQHARLDVERYRTLFQQDSIAKQEVDAQEALVRQYEGIVKSDQSQVENARLQLTFARITAPITGRVGLRLIDPGNIVRGGDATRPSMPR